MEARTNAAEPGAAAHPKLGLTSYLYQRILLLTSNKAAEPGAAAYSKLAAAATTGEYGYI